jgi:protein O-mannosyl-transferase
MSIASSPAATVPPPALSPLVPTAPLLQRPWLHAVLLFVLTVAAYIPAMRAEFIWDDEWYVENNQALVQPGGLWDIWFGMRLEPARIGEIPQYYPLVHTTFWLETRLWGLDPTGFHVVNVLIHATTVLLLWRLLVRLNVPGAWLAAAIFAVHPVHVESVAWITERKNILAGVFYIASALAYVRFARLSHDESEDTAIAPPVAAGQRPRASQSNVEDPHRTVSNERESHDPAIGARPAGALPRGCWLWYAASLALFACALLSKTVTSSLPAAALLVIYWRRGKIRLADVYPLLPFFAIGIPAGLFTSALERVRVGATGPDFDWSLAERVLIAGRGAWFYLGKLLVPHPLVFMYPKWEIQPAAAWQWAFPAAAALLVANLFVFRHRYGRGPLVAILFFGGTLLPALGFFNLYPMRYSYVADHFQYLASLGPIVGGAALAVVYARRFPRGATISAAAVVLLTLATLTWRQGTIFYNRDTLFSHVLVYNPRLPMALANHGLWLLHEGRLDEAEDRFRATLVEVPDHGDALAGLGRIATLRGDRAEAVAWLRKAADAHPTRASAHYRLAVALREAGDRDGALASCRRAIELSPDNEDARVELGIQLAERGQFDLAVVEYRAALAGHPTSIPAKTGLGIGLANLGKHKEAEPLLDEVLRADPANAVAHNTLGIVLASRGALPAATDHFRAALNHRRAFPEAHNNLGKALELQGDLNGAMAEYEAALRDRPQFAAAAKNLEDARARKLAGLELDK